MYPELLDDVINDIMVTSYAFLNNWQLEVGSTISSGDKILYEQMMTHFQLEYSWRIRSISWLLMS